MLASDSQVVATASIYPLAPRSVPGAVEDLQALIDIPLDEALSWARLRAAEILVELRDPDLQRLLRTEPSAVDRTAVEDAVTVLDDARGDVEQCPDPSVMVATTSRGLPPAASPAPRVPAATPAAPVPPVQTITRPPETDALGVPASPAAPVPPVRSRVTASAVLHPAAVSPVPAAAPPKPSSSAAASRRRERAAEHAERMARRLRRQFASRQALLGRATPSLIRAPARTTAASEPDPPVLTRALALIEARRWKDAIAPLEEAVRLRPSQKLRALLGVVHARRAAVERDFSSARRHYESVLAMVPEHAVAQRELLMISAVSG